MPKAEISWKRLNSDGERVQCYAHHVGKEWLFFQRCKRYDVWQSVPTPPLEDWLALLDAVQRLIPRRRQKPEEEDKIKKLIAERFPDWDRSGQ